MVNCNLYCITHTHTHTHTCGEQLLGRKCAFFARKCSTYVVFKIWVIHLNVFAIKTHAHFFVLFRQQNSLRKYPSAVRQKREKKSDERIEKLLLFLRLFGGKCMSVGWFCLLHVSEAAQNVEEDAKKNH